MTLYMKLRFDRPIPKNAYISPGKYEVETETDLIDFDFLESDFYEEERPDEIGIEAVNLDTYHYPNAAKQLSAALRNDTIKGFREFFVYTGEKKTDPEINLKAVVGAAFCLDDGTVIPCKKEWLEKINSNL